MSDVGTLHDVGFDVLSSIQVSGHGQTDCVTSFDSVGWKASYYFRFERFVVVGCWANDYETKISDGEFALSLFFVDRLLRVRRVSGSLKEKVFVKSKICLFDVDLPAHS